MRILVHDFGGHAFTIQLARKLADRGHEVHYAHSASVVTPQGDLTRKDTDSQTLHLYPIDLGHQIDRTNLRKRRESDIQHGHKVADLIKSIKPDLILSGNATLDPQRIVQEASHAIGVPFIFWLQDIVGVAAARILKKKLPIVGGFIGAYYRKLENKLLAQSDRVVVISDDFRPFVPLPADRVDVVENWAALDHIPVLPRQNEWGDEQGVAETFNFLYCGTLGMKHNPGLLVAIAEKFRDDPSVRVVVASEGASMDWIRGQINEKGLTNMKLLPFQPFASLPKMLASADVVIAILEPDAGVFSVPSKVLSYHCSGRALLLGVPPENLAAKIVTKADSGLVVLPTDTSAFVAAAEKLYNDPEVRARMGKNAREYADTTFDIEKVADRFESIFESALRK